MLICTARQLANASTLESNPSIASHARDRAEERKTPGPEGLHALPGRAGLIFRVGQGDLGECGAWATPDLS